MALGAAAGVWWCRRIPGHIFRDGDDWYVDEPVPRELRWWCLAGAHAATNKARARARAATLFEDSPELSPMAYAWRMTEDLGFRALGSVGADETTAGLDLAIGEPELLGRGLGTRVLRRFVEGVVFADPAITACICDPEVDNQRSLRAFARAGFLVVRRVRRPHEDGDRFVMRRGRT